MKLVLKETFFKFDVRASAFVCRLSYGERAGKHDETSLAIASGVPVQNYYMLHDNTQGVGFVRVCSSRFSSRYGEVSLPAEGKFEVAKVDEVVFLRSGQDDTDRVLAFVGCRVERGSVSIYERATTGRILKECEAHNEKEGHIDVALILEPGQRIVFHRESESHGVDSLIGYEWDGESLSLVLNRRREEWEEEQKIEEMASNSEAEVL